MKRLHWTSLVILVIIVSTFIYFNNLIEGYRGGHGGGHRSGRHMRRGGGYYGRGNINYMTHHYGNHGYNWYSPWYLFRGNVCKNGCINLGNRNWGWQNPGYGANDCWFSSDCDQC